MPDFSHLSKEQRGVMERQLRKRAKREAKMAEPLEIEERVKQADAAVVRTFRVLGVDFADPAKRDSHCLMRLEIGVCADGSLRVLSEDIGKPSTKPTAVLAFKAAAYKDVMR